MRAVIFAVVLLCCGSVHADELVFTVGQQLDASILPNTLPHFLYVRPGIGDSYTKISTGEDAFVGWGFELVPIDGDIRYYITEQRWDAESSPAAAALLADISNNPSASLLIEGPTIETTTFHIPFDPTSCQSLTGVCSSLNANDFISTTDTSGWAITSIDARLEINSRNRLFLWQFRFNGVAVPEPASLWLVCCTCGALLTWRRSRMTRVGRVAGKANPGANERPE
jgi:hypothetical protein